MNEVQLCGQVAGSADELEGSGQCETVNSKKHRWDLLILLNSVCCIHICFTHIPLVTLDMKRGYLEIINISLSEKGISAI